MRLPFYTRMPKVVHSIKATKAWFGRYVPQGISFALVFILLFSILAPALTPPVSASTPSWQDTAWQYRRAITIDNTANASSLSDYQVKVSLNSSNFDFSKAQPNGADLRFTDSGGTTLLSHWTEVYDSSAQTATVWVKVPSIAAGTTTVIYLYYGNSVVTSSSSGIQTMHKYEGWEHYSSGQISGQIFDTGDWNKYQGNPVLVPGEDGSWDSKMTTFVSVMEDGGTFYMYYTGRGSENKSRIGLATSTDGKNWTKYGSGPILDKGSAGEWDENQVWSPQVWKEDGTYYMIYTGQSVAGAIKVGLATSTDKINWIKSSNNPVFNDSNSWANNDTEMCGSVIKIGSTYYLWYNTLSAGSRQTSVATSSDLINWTPYQSTPIFKSQAGNNLRHQYCPNVFKYGDAYYIIINSQNATNDNSFLYLYKSSDPTFPETDRELVKIILKPGTNGDWDDSDLDTPYILTTDITRSGFYSDQFWMYYAGATGPYGPTKTWKTGLVIEPNLEKAVAKENINPIWTVNNNNAGTSTVNSSIVRSGSQSRDDDRTAPTYFSLDTGDVSQTRGAISAWVYRTSTGGDDVDIYGWYNNTLLFTAGLGANGKVHYWNQAFHDTTYTYSANTWYLIEVVFDTDTDRFGFSVYDSSRTLLVTQENLAFASAVPLVNRSYVYSGTGNLGHTYFDDYYWRNLSIPIPTAILASEEMAPATPLSSQTSYCSNTSPTSSPDLFQIDRVGRTARLYFAPAGQPYNKYIVAYGIGDSIEQFGVQFDQGYSSGVIDYTIHELDPNTDYSFKVQAANGCATGEWSNVLKAGATKSSKQSYYRVGGSSKSNANVSLISTPRTGKTVQEPKPTSTASNKNVDESSRANPDPSPAEPSPKPTPIEQSGGLWQWFWGLFI